MAANLGQAFLGAAGMVPTLVQELAAGNFHENRETFHDYIYSKLILGDDKGNISAVANSNPPVFPNTNLASSYPNPLPIISNMYNLPTSDSNRSLMDSNGDSSNVSGGKTFNSTLTKTPSFQKSGSSKKKCSQPQQIIAHTIQSSEDLAKLVKKSHHKKKEKTNVCDVCGRGFAEKYTLNRHMLTHTHVRPYSCSKCNMSFSRSDGLAKHMTTPHRRIDAHHCDVCGGTFNSEVSFEQHRREYGNTLPFVCNLCMLAFSQCCHLNYHMKSHTLSKMNDSLTHDDMDDNKSTIDVSELIPEDFSPTKKDIAKNPLGAHLFSPAKISEHVDKKKDDNSDEILDAGITVKSEVEEYIGCQAANQMSKNNAGHGLNLGHSSFDSINNFSSVTSSSMSQEGKYTQTGQSDNNLSPGNASAPVYLPDTTGRLISTSPDETVPIADADMKKYLDIKIPNPRLHDSSISQGGSLSEDGLFRCEICGKGFTRKYHMQRHVKLHIRGPVPKAHLLDWTRRPYACGVCKMGFTRQHHLTRHMLIHTGERPHSCHECGKAFRRFTNLTLHVRTVHGAERPFKCQICGRGFPRLYSLQRHLKLHAKSAANLTAENVDLLYAGFKPLNMASMDQLKDGKSLYSIDMNNTQLSSSQESVSSEHSDESERFDPESSGHEDSMDNIDPGISSSPVPHRDRYTLLRNDSGETGFHSDSGNRGHSKDHDMSSHSRQTDDQQARSASDSDSRFQNKDSRSNISNANRQNSSHASDELKLSTRSGSEVLRGQVQLPARTLSDYNQQPSLQSTDTEGFIPVGALLSHNIRTLDMSGGRNFNDLAIRVTNSFPLSQRSDNADGFVLSQQRIQSPHPLLNSLERPGSRSVMNQTSGSDTVIHTPAGYVRAPTSLLPQQCASMDLTTSHATGIKDPGVYSHSLHNVEMGSGRSSVKDPQAYSHGHNPFSASVHERYQQQLAEGLGHLEGHPDPRASPLPVSSRGNNMQY